MDVPLKVAVELGRAKILVQDLLKLHKGSVIELNKLAGEPLEILINERVSPKARLSSSMKSSESGSPTSSATRSGSVI